MSLSRNNWVSFLQLLLQCKFVYGPKTLGEARVKDSQGERVGL